MKRKQEDELKEIQKLTKQMGLLKPKEGALLYKLAKYGPGKGAIVEIGTFKGKSAIYLARGSKSAGREKVYTIDPYNPRHPWGEWRGKSFHSVYIPHRGVYRSLLKNIKKAKVEDWVIPIVNPSCKAAKKWKKPMRLLFIDGLHDYKNVKRDFLLWEKYLVKGGIIAFHDSAGKAAAKVYPAPSIVVREDIVNSKRFKNIKVTASITCAQKIRSMTKPEEIKFMIKYKPMCIVDRIPALLGKIGIFLKNNSPWLYSKIKRLKNE